MSNVMEVRVVEVVRETADTHSLVLEPLDGDSEALSYRPGQFLTLRIPTDRPDGCARCYSICSSPSWEEKLKVTVKRTREGYGSNWICDNIVAGDVLQVLKPAGNFTPHSLDEDLLLIAGGSGITPVLSILKTALRAGRASVTLLYANRDEQSVIFRDELQALALEYGERLTMLHWLESVQGLPTGPALRTMLRPYVDREAFICGPELFMDLAFDSLIEMGAPHRRVHVERFTSLAGDPFAEAEAPAVAADPDEPVSEVEVTLDGETRTVVWPRSAKLLDVLLAEGMDAPYSCREGACSACACVVLEGEVDLEHNEVLDAQDLEEGIFLSCQARPLTDKLKVSFDE